MQFFSLPADYSAKLHRMWRNAKIAVQSKAELLLIGEEVLPEKDLETEVRALLERRDIVVKAAQIQQGASMKQRGERLRRNT